MKKSELIELRKKVCEERERRKRFNELLDEELVKEYLNIIKSNPSRLNEEDTKGILKRILKDFEVTKTNGIYVCTSASYVYCSISYQDTNYYSRNVLMNSPAAEYKIYTDIESGEIITAVKENGYLESDLLISEAEKSEIILNPYNSYKKNNGYDEVRLEFFETALKEGQAKAKKLILSKYPRI